MIVNKRELRGKTFQELHSLRNDFATQLQIVEEALQEKRKAEQKNALNTVMEAIKLYLSEYGTLTLGDVDNGSIMCLYDNYHFVADYANETIRFYEERDENDD